MALDGLLFPLTLLRHAIVIHSWLRWVAAATVLLLSSVHLGMRSHGIALLRVSIAHGSHSRGGHAAKASAHAVSHGTTATGWVATTRTIVGCSVDANSATIKPIKTTTMISGLLSLPFSSFYDSQEWQGLMDQLLTRYYS